MFPKALGALVFSADEQIVFARLLVYIYRNRCGTNRAHWGFLICVAAALAVAKVFT